MIRLMFGADIYVGIKVPDFFAIVANASASGEATTTESALPVHVSTQATGNATDVSDTGTSTRRQKVKLQSFDKLGNINLEYILQHLFSDDFTAII